MRQCSHHTSQPFAKESPGRSWSRLKQVDPRAKCRLLPKRKPMDKKGSNINTFRDRVLFNLKERNSRVEQRGENQAEHTASGLKELALKWFTGTQAPILLHGDSFPTWFQGLISRRDAEYQLRDKPVGCFLIRLSNKAVGYILSYRGHNRCRHFVINQNKAGKFIVCGDTETHSTLTSLIEYYKSSPIEPFGEYLTTSCFECYAADIYDVVHLSEPDNIPTVRAPTPPPRSNRKPVLATRPYDPQVLLPMQGWSHNKKIQFSRLSNERSISANQILYAKSEKTEALGRSQTPVSTTRGLYRVQLVQNRAHRAHQACPKQGEQLSASACASGTVYSELQLRNLNKRAARTQQQSHKPSSSHRHVAPADKTSLPNNCLYHKTEGSWQDNHTLGQSHREPPQHTSQHDTVTYSTICHRPTSSHVLACHTYEEIPNHGH